MSDFVFDHPLLMSKYFFPRPDAPDGDGVFEVRAADGESVLRCWKSAPHTSANARTILHFHGNGEVVGDYVELAPVLNRLGVNVVFGEYRGYGGSTGAPTISTILDDAEAIFQALGLPEERVVAFARSLGAFCVLELAAKHPRLGGVILESSIADVVERFLMRITPEEVGLTEAELEAEVMLRCDHESKIRSYQGPVLVLHTEQDSMVDVSHGERLHDWAGGKDKELVLLPRGDHNSAFADNQKMYLAALEGFLKRI